MAQDGCPSSQFVGAGFVYVLVILNLILALLDISCSCSLNYWIHKTLNEISHKGNVSKRVVYKQIDMVFVNKNRVKRNVCSEKHKGGC